VNGFAVRIGGDEIEELKQCVLIGPELVDGPTRPFGGFADFNVTVECLVDQFQQSLALWPREAALDLFRDFQQAISELGQIPTSSDPLFQIPRHDGCKCNHRAPTICDPVLYGLPRVTARRASVLHTARLEIHPTGVNRWATRYTAAQLIA